MHVESTYLLKITRTSVATSMILGRLRCITITSTSLKFIKEKHVKWWVCTYSTGKTENDSNTKILGLVNLRRFQGFVLATWPHERPRPWFASHRLLLDNGRVHTCFNGDCCLICSNIRKRQVEGCGERFSSFFGFITIDCQVQSPHP